MEIQGEVYMDQCSVGPKFIQKIPFVLATLALVFAFPLAGQDKKDSDKPKSGKDQGSIGFIASKEAGAQEVGLPLYPGSRPHKDKSDDSSAAQLGLWGGSSGFKLVVLKRESNDAPAKVAAFYRKALAKYGKVLNCADPSEGKKDSKKSPHELDCESDRPKEGEITLKAGTEEKQHAVGIQPNGTGSLFQLVYVETRGSEDEK